jgi:selenocysteine lyase/cysteine desulfurase
MPGHKGLYGPQGTGLLLCGSRAAEPLLYGGTGSQSLRQEMPDFLPDRLEAGTQNVAGIAGLLAGLRYVQAAGTETILAHEQRLIRRMVRELSRIPGLRLFDGTDTGAQSGVLSFQAEGVDCEELGERLSRRGVAVRAGLHCAPYAHQSAGTLETGTVRASVSAFNTEGEIDRFAAILREVL